LIQNRQFELKTVTEADRIPTAGGQPMQRDLSPAPVGDILTTKGIVKTLYDPACGTDGMLSD